MLNLKKISLISCVFLSLHTFGQVIKTQDTYVFKQKWVVKKDYLFSAKILLENFIKGKKMPLFSMQSGYKVHPISYQNNILTAKTENLINKKGETIKVDTSKGFFLTKKTPPVLSLLNGIWSQKPVKIGDKWTLATQDMGKFGAFFEDPSVSCTYHFKEIGTLQKISCAKIELNINQGLKKGLKGSGIAWIRLSDGILAQLDIDFVHSLSKPSPDGTTQRFMKVNLKQIK